MTRTATRISGFDTRPTLRDWQESDLGFLTGLRNDSALQAQLMATVRGSDESAVRAWLARRTAGQGFTLSIICAEDGLTPAGYLQTEPDGDDGSLRFGICVAPAFQGSGLGRAALSHLAGKLAVSGCPVLRCAVDSRNRRAIALYRSLGFRFAARQPDTVDVNGEARRALFMERDLRQDRQRKPCRVVISQSMYFPWAGMLDQIRLADVFVHYDDVQFSKGSFTNRVQVRTAEGRAWMTAPLAGHSLGDTISRTRIAPVTSFRDKHLAMLKRSFTGAPLADEALALAHGVLDQEHETIGSLARASLMALVGYFGLDKGTVFLDSADLTIDGRSSERVFAIADALGATDYITGHGARNYLDHGLFAKAGMSVSYMDYDFRPWPQGHGEFTPFVTALDLAAHAGTAGAFALVSRTRAYEEHHDGPC